MAVPAEIAARVVDPRTYADGSIFESYRWFRQNDPFALIESQDFDPFRVVTRHADIMEVGRRNDVFHNGLRPVLNTKVGERKMRELTGGGPMVKSLIQMDDEEHRKYRGLTSAWFQPNNVKRMEADIRAMARAAVDRMAACGETCDFVNEVSLHYPLRVIMSILGVPEEDEALMLKLTQEIFGSTDPDLNKSGYNSLDLKDEEQKVDVSTILSLMGYFQELTKRKRANPSDDLASVIANAQVDGAPIPDLEMMGYYIITATAGHDTTSSSTAGAMWALAENPAEFRKLKDDPSLMGTMIDEAIRYTSPVKHFMRTAMQDTQVGDQKLSEGEWLMLCFASGNRDETVFEDPDAFRVDRKPNRHVAFGYGAHLCLGQYLGKMEMRILFEELIPRLESVEIDGDAAMSQALFVNGPKRLPIRYKLR
ncbi:cytochrome P450 [Novosphingobium malaysiense]|uniref:Cytochrome P450 n=1 Tax=Novosphingobium malaysiense TaxID=1348853 RepID=A0A0B1ZKJ1_9SPHN|nr:cytochrome P450 [Novosphingobium malaysiense]KHK89859.1 cytochrome P450 [Novosphingobium malaysiense]